jgi:hypothetical protein
MRRAKLQQGSKIRFRGHRDLWHDLVKGLGHWGRDGGVERIPGSWGSWTMAQLLTGRMHGGLSLLGACRSDPTLSSRRAWDLTAGTSWAQPPAVDAREAARHSGRHC